MSRDEKSESLTLMDLDIEELERRLELAPNQCLVAETASMSCKAEGNDVKVEGKVG
jgi:hypothetical protein